MSDLRLIDADFQPRLSPPRDSLVRRAINMSPRTAMALIVLIWVVGVIALESL